jgi:hypothetical protein
MYNQKSGTKQGGSGIMFDPEFRRRLLLLLQGVYTGVNQNTDFEMQYLLDANDSPVWVEITYVNGVKTYTYYDGPGGATIIPVQPLKPMSLSQDAELIEDEFVAVTADLINGYSIGDQISRISYFDITTSTPVLVSSFWYNKTTASILTTVDITDLEDQDGPIITTPGTGGFQVTVDGTYPFSFDADSITIENFTPQTITVTIDGVLGNDFFIARNTGKDIVYDVAKAEGVVISGIISGQVLITYNRGK